MGGGIVDPTKGLPMTAVADVQNALEHDSTNNLSPLGTAVFRLNWLNLKLILLAPVGAIIHVHTSNPSAMDSSPAAMVPDCGVNNIQGSQGQNHLGNTGFDMFAKKRCSTATNIFQEISTTSLSHKRIEICMQSVSLKLME
jgi:hypothetical protein